MIGRILAAGLMLLNVAATEPKTLMPTGKWMVEFADHDCILSRHYGKDPKDALILSFRQLPMQTGIDMYVIKQGRNSSMRSATAKLDFGSGRSIEARSGAYLVATGLRTIWITVEDDSYKAAVRSGVAHVSVPGEVDESFAVPGIGPALQLLDQCAVNLGELWGISKDQQKRVGKPAKMIDRESLFNSDDYPVGALRQDASGKTVVRYMVDESGSPSDCVVLKRSGNKDLDSRSCSILLRRAQFEPARDINGKPMRSVAVTSINWLLMN